MTVTILNETDKLQIQAMGISEQHVYNQIEIFQKGAPYLRLTRPCTLGNGIKKFDDAEVEALVAEYPTLMKNRNVMKFVPASGAATRMFKYLNRFSRNTSDQKEDEQLIEENEGSWKELIQFFNEIQKFAFYNDLERVVAKSGQNLDVLLAERRFKPIIEYVLTAKGLNYMSLPKGLLKFHTYPEGARTAFEEHFVEALEYVLQDQNGLCKLHFTVLPEHKTLFQTLTNALIQKYNEVRNVRFDITFSSQLKATDTIAVDMDNQPFRLDDGSLLFRPAGHGALIKNLSAIDGDIVYIKNIDNVVPDYLKPITIHWKKALGSYLAKIQEKMFAYLWLIQNDTIAENELTEAVSFLKHVLCIQLPQSQPLNTKECMKEFVFSKLNRPLRVCGMVKNQGEPGGGPFWVSGLDGMENLQIVETAQIDMSVAEQRAILTSATHFNPVDLVCGVRDFRGELFDLDCYIDPNAVFISEKSKEGRDLKALELPGLWNGAMADWNTIFVEVPLITFNPVKSINDLLRDEHLEKKGNML